MFGYTANVVQITEFVHSEATTNNGNFIDLIFVNEDVTCDLNIDQTVPSDHYAITFHMEIEKVTCHKFH